MPNDREVPQDGVTTLEKIVDHDRSDYDDDEPERYHQIFRNTSASGGALYLIQSIVTGCCRHEYCVRSASGLE